MKRMDIPRMRPRKWNMRRRRGDVCAGLGTYLSRFSPVPSRAFGLGSNRLRLREKTSSVMRVTASRKRPPQSRPSSFLYFTSNSRPRWSSCYLKCLPFTLSNCSKACTKTPWFMDGSMIPASYIWNALVLSSCIEKGCWCSMKLASSAASTSLAFASGKMT